MRKLITVITLFFFTLLSHNANTYDIIGGGGSSGGGATGGCPTDQFINSITSSGISCGVPSAGAGGGYNQLQQAGVNVTQQVVMNFLAPFLVVNDGANSKTSVSMSKADANTDGYLATLDWNTFNNKQDALTFSAPVINTGGTISCRTATGSLSGCLTSTDWTTFNAKESALTFTDPIHRATNTITCIAATGSVPGCLSAADWTTFNAKQAAISTSGAVSNQFVTGFTAPNTFTRAQPSFSNISGTVAAAQLPNPSASTLGGVQSHAAVSHEFLTSISILGVPVGAQPAFTDISGSVAATQLPNPSATTLGGVQSKAVVANNFLTGISTSGVPSAARPACADISDAGTMCTATAANYFSVANNLSEGTAATMRTNLGLGSAATHPSTDFENALTFSAPLARATNTISIPAADATHNGYLSSTDWSNFDAKLSSFSANTPLALAGGVLSIPAASGSVSGYLSSTDWTAFNNKFSNFTVNSVQSLTASSTIDCNSFIINPVKGSTAAVTLTSNPQITAGTLNGQQCYLVGGDVTNIVTVSDGNGISLPGFAAMPIGLNETLILKWDSGNSVWVAENFTQSQIGRVSGVAPLDSGGLVPTANLPSTISYLGSSIALTSEVSGVLPVANGGTGSSSQNFLDLTSTQAKTTGALTFDAGTIFDPPHETSDHACPGGGFWINDTSGLLTYCSGSTKVSVDSNTAGTGIAISGGVVSLDINALTEDTTPDVAADFLAAYDVSAGSAKKIKLDTLLALVNGLTEDTTPDGANDFLLTYDTSAGAAKKVKPTNLTVGKATALAANGSNCSAGNYPLGVDASGAVENCTQDAIGGFFSLGCADGTGTLGTTLYAVQGLISTACKTTNTLASLGSIISPVTGTIKNLHCGIQTTNASNTVAFTVMKANFAASPSYTATNVTCTVATTANNCNSAALTDTITAGQVMTIRLVFASAEFATNDVTCSWEVVVP